MPTKTPKTVCATTAQTSDAEFLAEAQAILEAAGNVSYRAMLFGLKLAAKRDELAHRGNGTFGAWMESTFKSLRCLRTLYRWIGLGQSCLKQIEMPVIDISVIELLTATEESLTTEHREAKQLFLDFTDGKTMAECIRGVAFEGDEPHRLTRAINGKTGGFVGEDRKAWDVFILVKLRNLTEHLRHWKSFKGGQAQKVEMDFLAAVEKWPTPVLEFLALQIKAEIKNRL